MTNLKAREVFSKFTKNAFWSYWTCYKETKPNWTNNCWSSWMFLSCCLLLKKILNCWKYTQRMTLKNFFIMWKSNKKWFLHNWKMQSMLWSCCKSLKIVRAQKDLNKRKQTIWDNTREKHHRVKFLCWVTLTVNSNSIPKWNYKNFWWL